MTKLSKKTEKAPAPPPVAPVRIVPPVPAKTDNALLKRMMEDLNALDGKLNAVSMGTGKIVYVREVEEKTPTAQVAVNDSVPQKKSNISNIMRVISRRESG